MVAVLDLFKTKRAKAERDFWSEYRALLSRIATDKPRKADADRLVELADELALADDEVAQHAKLYPRYIQAQKAAAGFERADADCDAAREKVAALQEQFAAVTAEWRRKIRLAGSEKSAAKNAMEKARAAKNELRRLRDSHPLLFA